MAIVKDGLFLKICLSQNLHLRAQLPRLLPSHTSKSISTILFKSMHCNITDLDT